jgi:hypothetical protein
LMMMLAERGRGEGSDVSNGFFSDPTCVTDAPRSACWVILHGARLT